jgi:hypothetical protein
MKPIAERVEEFRFLESKMSLCSECVENGDCPADEPVCKLDTNSCEGTCIVRFKKVMNCLHVFQNLLKILT